MVTLAAISGRRFAYVRGDGYLAPSVNTVEFIDFPQSVLDALASEPLRPEDRDTVEQIGARFSDLGVRVDLDLGPEDEPLVAYAYRGESRLTSEPCRREDRPMFLALLRLSQVVEQLTS